MTCDSSGAGVGLDTPVSAGGDVSGVPRPVRVLPVVRWTGHAAVSTAYLGDTARGLPSTSITQSWFSATRGEQRVDPAEYQPNQFHTYSPIVCSICDILVDVFFIFRRFLCASLASNVACRTVDSDLVMNVRFLLTLTLTPFGTHHHHKAVAVLSTQKSSSSYNIQTVIHS